MIGALNDHRAKGDGMIVIDAVSQEDLKTIATAIVATRLPLMCGCAGLAEELPDALAVSRKGRSVFVLAGSTSAVTARQIAFLQALPEVQIIDLASHFHFDNLDDSETGLSGIMDEALQHLKHGRDVAVWCSFSLRATNAIAKRIGATSFESRFFNTMGTLAKVVVATVPIAGLILTGGDTAYHAAQALNVTATEILEEVQPGIPAVEFIGGIGDGLHVVTKAGAFGGDDALVAAVKYLRRTCPT